MWASFFRFLAWWTLWPLSYAQFTRIPKVAWFGMFFLSWSMFFVIGGFVIMPAMLDANLTRIVTRVLPGCWGNEDGQQIAMFYHGRGRQAEGGSALFLYRLYRDEAVDDLAGRFVGYYSPRLIEMHPNQKYAPWTLDMGEFGEVSVERIDGGQIRVDGNQIIASGLYAPCDPPVDREWRVGT